MYLKNLLVKSGRTYRFSPVAHGFDDRRQGAAEVGQAVFGLRRDDGVDFSGDDARIFQFAQLLGQHFRRRLGDGVLELAVATGALQEMPEDDALVFAAKEA